MKTLADMKRLNVGDKVLFKAYFLNKNIVEREVKIIQTNAIAFTTPYKNKLYPYSWLYFDDKDLKRFSHNNWLVFTPHINDKNIICDAIDNNKKSIIKYIAYKKKVV